MADSSLKTEVNSLTGPGLTLRLHYQNIKTDKVLRTGNYDMVIVQGQSEEPLTSSTEFVQYAGLLAEKIGHYGAEMRLFMTWGYAERDTMARVLEGIYREVANLLHVQVVPVGLAWQRVHKELPKLQLYAEDGVHPSIYGTYLAAWVFYYSIVGDISPMLVYTAGLPEHEAEALRKIAQEVVLGI